MAEWCNGSHNGLKIRWSQDRVGSSPTFATIFMKTKPKKITRFMDMHSGGKLKTPYTHIYINEPLEKAKQVFKETFQRDTNNITCKCCGEDFVHEEYDSLEEATAYDRGCEWNDHGYDYKTAKISLDEYFSGSNKVLLVVN